MGNHPHRPRLIFIGEPFDGRVCELELEITTVGRGSQNHLCIQDPSVSARHCEILAHDSEIIVRDLKSSNGTFVNAVPIDGQTQLKNGQIVRFGNVNARLELPSPDASHSASDATAIYQHAKYTREARAERENPKPAPQPVKLDAGASHPDAEHTVSLRKDEMGGSPATPQAPSPTQSSTRQAPGKWLIPGALIVVAAILWWWLRK